MPLRAFLLLIVLLCPKGAAQAHSLEVFGYAGDLGEWELTAIVAEKALALTKEFSGPFTMTHVGICTVDDPEQKKGEIRLRISESAARMRATLSIDGIECRYSGQLSNFYSGEMSCPHRPAVPLKLWVK